MSDNQISPEMQQMMDDPRMQERARKMATRYLYSPIADCLVSGSIPSGFIPRGFIYSVGIIVRANTHAGQIELNRDDETKAFEEIFPEEIVRTVLNAYQNRGAVEITSLMGMPEATFKDLKLNDLIFGVPRFDALNQVIAPSGEQVRQGVAAVLKRFESASPNVKARMQNVTREILRSVEIAETYCKQVLDESHANIDAARNGDLSKNATYDQRDFRAFAFLGREPETAAWRVKTEPIKAPTGSPDWDEWRTEIGKVVAEAVTVGVTEAIKSVAPVLSQPAAARGKAPQRLAKAAA